MVDGDVFGLDHFHESGLAMGAAPAALLAAAVGSFGDTEITDGVVDHYGAGFEATGGGFSAGVVACKDAGGQCEFGIVAMRDGFFFVLDDLNREDWAEGL